MQTKFKRIASAICAGVCALSVVSCSGETAGGEPILCGAPINSMGEPKAVEAVDYSTLCTDEYKAFKSKVETFAADFAAYAYADYNERNNFTVSPISVYTALALASECANGDTRREILSALGVTHEQLTTHFSTLYRSLEVENKIDGQLRSMLNLSNSIWVNNGAEVKQECIKSLSDNFYAYSYSADFWNNNQGANAAVRDFVSTKTKGLIDKDFDLSPETLFALINTVYLKTVWNDGGYDLPFANGTFEFTANDGSVKTTELLQGNYIAGRAAEFDSFSTFYTRTFDGYKIKFMLPKDDCSIEQVFTADNIAVANSLTDYGDYDAEENVRYKTRVLFPEYKCKYDEDIKDILQNEFDIDLLFKDHVNYSNGCDFSTLSDESCYCAKVRHVTDLTVNKKGIEGAAVTILGMDADSAPDPTLVKCDFIVNKSFGFIITDWQNVTLFSGVVNNI